MKVAVVGSGAAGLSATWALNEHSDHEVHLYEAEVRAGGHANAVPFVSKAPDGREQFAYIVFNPYTYLNFLRFLKLHPDIAILPTQMSFSISRDNGAFEWASDSLATLFCQPWRIFDGTLWRMLYDIFRFNASARRLVSRWNKMDIDDCDGCSIGEYLERGAYSDTFRDNYLIPMTAAIWSTPPNTCALDFPARTLIQFMHNHFLLQLTGKPSWLIFKDGSQAYIKMILLKLASSQLHLCTPVKSVKNTSSDKGVVLTTADGQEEVYDHVIMACHSDTALSILKEGGGIRPEEENILSMFKWTKNESVLHSDTRLLPKSHLAKACWNYLTFSAATPDGQTKANNDQVSVTFDMNVLQHIPAKKHGPVLVSINPPFEPEPSTVQGRWTFDHPVLDGNAIRAQRLLRTIQGIRGITYAGGYHNFGFHEDAFTSGLLAATTYSGLNAKLPFELEFAEGSPWDDPSRKRPAKRDLYAEWLAMVFDIVQAGGVRFIVGTAGLLLMGHAGITKGQVPLSKLINSFWS
ncbi:FAD/NAD(P)-binding domain-containing protein [Guyanagaster necrorhizus]|uniref:FAD/NAD(P)-binding domain-containing protein n=1 Tax=Guyanagaster necrorhizus TaxID=856835 RepID=A0A9P8ARS9_9AGAR|nr:FAD/NAD(P)-binding domain-containing protein [Guyanagaster necrorhizus MCA 3950]KAG7445519.1 FAD/NAD(P)-binding domain-containing protein [Guyanagaster necrorhizus MCA 3950]